jgi:dTMP kinase
MPQTGWIISPIKTDGILKKMDEGYTVITDRYYFSSYAYHGTHMDINWVINANSLSADLLRPDLNIYIDISPEESMKRLNKGRDSIELYESTENLRQVKEKYFEAFELLADKEKISVINGNRPEKEIANDIWREVSKLVGSDSHHMENTRQ